MGRILQLCCAKDAKNGNGDVLLAPKRPWDAFPTLTLDGRNELQLRAGALLARSGRVVLLGSGGNTSGLVGAHGILSLAFDAKRIVIFDAKVYEIDCILSLFVFSLI